MNIESKILIIAPYKKMAQIYKKRLEELGMNIQVEFPENLNLNYDISSKTVLSAFHKLIDKKKEVIITRGVFAKTIKRNFDVNVIETTVSGYDVLNTMYSYKNFKGSIGTIECGIFTDKIKKIGELLGLDVKVYNVEEIDDYHICFKRAIDEGVKLIFGGSWGVYNKACIEKNNVIYEMIESSESEVEESVGNAIDTCRILIDEKTKSEMLKTVVDFARGGIVSINKEGKITTFNYGAERIFNIKEKDVIGKYLNKTIPEIELTEVLKSNKIVLDDVKKMNNMEIVINRVPMIVDNEIEGAIATFQKVKEIQEIEKKVRYKLSDRGLTAKNTFNDIKGRNEKTLKTIEVAKAYCKIDSTILITGETGTGKEVFAQSIHNGSPRKNNPFVAVNCSALPGNLLESELFGYVEGSFTGARKGGKLGIFELAHTGTIFLDEIGDIDKPLQARLLRVLQEKEIMRIGDDKVIPIDVRVIAATNKNLYREVMKGNFRADLYYRLNILNIKLSPLRERKEDLKDLIDVIIKNINKQLRFKVSSIDNNIYNALYNYDWPGNIRELQNVLEKIVVLTQTGIAEYNNVKYIIEELQNDIEDEENEDIYKLTLEEIEQKVIQKVLKEENYNKKRTAERLGIGRSTLFRKIDKF